MCRAQSPAALKRFRSGAVGLEHSGCLHTGPLLQGVQKPLPFVCVPLTFGRAAFWPHMGKFAHFLSGSFATNGGMEEGLLEPCLYCGFTGRYADVFAREPTCTFPTSNGPAKFTQTRKYDWI